MFILQWILRYIHIIWYRSADFSLQVQIELVLISCVAWIQREMKGNSNVLNTSIICTSWTCHYNDVIMDSMASQITSLTIVYSAVYSGADQRKYQSSASLAFVREIHRGPANSPHKWPVTRKTFPFDDVIKYLASCEVGFISSLCKNCMSFIWNYDTFGAVK